MPSITASQIGSQGFALLRDVFTPAETCDLCCQIESAIHAHGESGAIRSRPGDLYGARNMLDIFPASARLASHPPLAAILTEMLGPQFGLVRALYFDKPPTRSWSLPWHQDLTIAVRDNRLPSSQFTKPTVKAGVSHVEAPTSLLQSMLTLRLHLDEVTHENGPLSVVPGSHQFGKQLPDSYEHAQVIFAAAGDVLAMRPLLAHSSGHSIPGTLRHRRILHLEFAADPVLPDGFAWHRFIAHP